MTDRDHADGAQPHTAGGSDTPDARSPTTAAPSGPGLAEHAVSALGAWFGDYLEKTDNGLHQPMAFFEHNAPVAPEALPAPASGKVCVLVHGLGCNEGLWDFPSPHPSGSYGSLLQRDFGYMPLYVRFNSGLRISDNGVALCALLDAYCERHGTAVEELMLLGHSMGGLIVRSACHLGTASQQRWPGLVRHCFYLGSPHLGAPLEKATNVASHVLGMFDTTATRVIRDLLNTRAAGIKDLRFGNLVDEDWLDYDPDALMQDRRVPIPWLQSATHHRIVGHAVAGMAGVGDAMVRPDSASGHAHGSQPAAPDAARVHVMPGFDHLALARHPEVYAVIERELTQLQEGQ